MIVTSDNIVLAPGASLRTPIFGWHNLVSIGNVTADSEDPEHPARNIANPATHLYWRAAPGSPPADYEYLTFDISATDAIDYIGVARHNFGSAQIEVAVEGASELTGSPPAYSWQEIVQGALLADDGPAIFRFTSQALLAVRLRLRAGSAPAEAGVVYVGKLLVMERGGLGDVVPINLSAKSTVVNGRSESGNFLGRILVSQMLQSGFAFNHLRQSWYRAQMQPFINATKDTPFFFAWKPYERPSDVGYCWLTNDPQPAIHFDTGTVAIELQMGALAP